MEQLVNESKKGPVGQEATSKIGYCGPLSAARDNMNGAHAIHTETPSTTKKPHGQRMRERERHEREESKTCASTQWALVQQKLHARYNTMGK